MGVPSSSVRAFDEKVGNVHTLPAAGSAAGVPGRALGREL